MRKIELKTSTCVQITPRDVKFPKYVLPNCLGNGEAEEIVARYISICQEDNEWCGINLRDFANCLQEDLNNIEEVSKKVQTLIILDQYKIGGPNFAEIGFWNLNRNEYIKWEKQAGENYILPTEKLLKTIEKYVSE